MRRFRTRLTPTAAATVSLVGGNEVSLKYCALNVEYDEINTYYNYFLVTARNLLTPAVNQAVVVDMEANHRRPVIGMYIYRTVRAKS